MLLIATYWLLAAGIGGAEQQLLVDEVVAEVNREVITRSDVYQEAVLVLVKRRGQPGLNLEMTPEFISHVLELLINQRLLLYEANRLGMPLEEEQDRDVHLEEFKKHFQNEEEFSKFITKYSFTQAALLESLQRHKRVERLKERKLQMVPEISEKEIRYYYEKNREKLGGVSLDLMKQPIRLKLLARKGRKVLKRWIQELRRRSQVKLLVDLSKKSE